MLLDRIRALPRDGVALDTETHQIQPGLIAPPLVCGSIAVLDLEAHQASLFAGKLEREGKHSEASSLRDEWSARPLVVGELLAKRDTIEFFVELIRDREKTIVGANIAFDLAVLGVACAKAGIDVMPDIFAALAEGRVYDLQIAEALHAIAGGHLDKDPRTSKPLVNRETGRKGSYSLDNCVELVLGRVDAKENDQWRLAYATLEHLPISEWPRDARVYPVDDACNTLETALAQAGHLNKVTPQHDWGENGCETCGAKRYGEMCIARRPHRNLCDLANQVKAAFALHLGAVWGFHVDQRKVDQLYDYYTAKRSDSIQPFIDAGVIRPEGSVNEAVLKKLVAQAYGSKDTCRVCGGSGRVLAPNPRTLVCTECRGRSAPWKAGGKIKEPTVASCLTCKNSGRVVDVRHTVGCHGDEYINDEGKKRYEKTCDGTGLQLSPSVPRSPADGIKKDADTLFESGDEFLMTLGDFFADKKELNDYIPFLRKARKPVNGHLPGCAKAKRCACPGPYVSIPLNPKPNPLLVTGRVSSRDHMQTFKRAPGFVEKYPDGPEVYIPSLRECIVARPPIVELIEVPDDYVLRPGEEWA